MGARPTRKKTRIAERRENLVVSLSVSFIARAPRFDPHQKRTRWSLSNSLSTPIQNGRRIQIQMLQFVRARELDIPTEFRRDTTQSEKQRQQQKDDDERKERRVRKRTFARLFVLRKEDCVFCVARIREFKREKRTRKKPLNGKKKRPPPKKRKAKSSLKRITCMYFYLLYRTSTHLKVVSCLLFCRFV